MERKASGSKVYRSTSNRLAEVCDNLKMYQWGDRKWNRKFKPSEYLPSASLIDRVQVKIKIFKKPTFVVFIPRKTLINHLRDGGAPSELSTSAPPRSFQSCLSNLDLLPSSSLTQQYVHAGSAPNECKSLLKSGDYAHPPHPTAWRTRMYKVKSWLLQINSQSRSDRMSYRHRRTSFVSRHNWARRT
jgi:hypothetical protein